MSYSKEIAQCRSTDVRLPAYTVPAYLNLAYCRPYPWNKVAPIHISTKQSGVQTDPLKEIKKGITASRLTKVKPNYSELRGESPPHFLPSHRGQNLVGKK